MTSENVLVSVVMCTYNGMHFIRESIESVLNQTFTNFEFIIWNDGSTDETEKIVQSFKDTRIKYHYHSNTGLGKALHLACQQAKGKYIARIDDDDICLRNRLEIEFDYLESHPNIVLVSSSVFFIDEEGNTLGRSFPWTWSCTQRRNVNIVHPAVMFRTEQYRQTCGYLNILSGQDIILWSKLIKHGDFYNIKKPLIKYRWLATSLSHVIDYNSPYFNMLRILRNKICKEDVPSDIDIELYNHIYILSKKQKNNIKIGEFKYKTSLEERLFTVLKRIIGKYSAEEAVFLSKNLYAWVKY